jgi:hypothetical protein
VARPELIVSCWVGLALCGCSSGAVAPVPPDPAARGEGCPRAEEVVVWSSLAGSDPRRPSDLIAIATDRPIDGLRVIDTEGRIQHLIVQSGGGPPWSLRARGQSLPSAASRVEVTRHEQVVACSERPVDMVPVDAQPRAWNRATEALYAAWIEHLFDAPPDRSLQFPSLEPVLSDPSRNFLLGPSSDGDGRTRPAEPDCADLPYVLRAYFGWRLGLPFASRHCNRGRANAAPTCEEAIIETGFLSGSAGPDTFDAFVQTLSDRVHSGNARTALEDTRTDFYPIALDRSLLWPGTIFADPYGHILMIVKWIPQGTGSSGQLLAIDAQPDNSVARKRFWEGTFLFDSSPNAGAGFKAFRPLVASPAGDVRTLRNSEIDGRTGRAPFSLEQSGLTADDFYARMQRLINPNGLEPETAYQATRAALMEQLETRVASVETGEAFMRSRPGQVIAMPLGAAIFETVGPWEDYATPSRDMRLLIALRVLADLPGRIRRYPELFLLQGARAEDAAGRVARLHEHSLDADGIQYRRTDGSPWPLTLRDIYARRRALEIAYNPNDCVERRWGASEETPDLATCRRQAPKDQRARMEAYRVWFRDTVRPTR